jgi:hypothetical protein
MYNVDKGHCTITVWMGGVYIYVVDIGHCAIAVWMGGVFLHRHRATLFRNGTIYCHSLGNAGCLLMETYTYRTKNYHDFTNM